jgi:chromosome segregation ATPase
MLKGELAKLTNSNKDSIRQLFRDQEQNCLDDLISRRNSLEEKSSMLTVSIDEMKADRARLETSITADNAGAIIIESRIAEIMDQLVTLNQKLLACTSFQVDIQTQFDNCKREVLEEEAEKMHLKSEIDDLRDAFRQKLAKLFDNCTKYGQNSLADKCRSHFGSILVVEEQSYVIVSLVECTSKDGKLETLILEELEESKKLMFDFAGQDHLTLLARDPHQCLQKYR